MEELIIPECCDYVLFFVFVFFKKNLENARKGRAGLAERRSAARTSSGAGGRTRGCGGWPV